MDDLVCEYCGRIITTGDYIETKYDEIFCNGMSS